MFKLTIGVVEGMPKMAGSLLEHYKKRFYQVMQQKNFID
jgi:hypothetical protein